MKDLKYEYQNIFPCWEGSNLILGKGKENQIFILRTPATIKFLHQILKNCHFGVKKNNYPSRWICMTHIWFLKYSIRVLGFSKEYLQNSIF